MESCVGIDNEKESCDNTVFDKHRIFNNKRIIFVGPLGNPTNAELKLYDIVIRTNNFFSIDKTILKSTRCDVLLVNSAYYRYNYGIILQNLDKYQYLMCFNKNIYSYILKVRKKKWLVRKNKNRFIVAFYDAEKCIVKTPLLLIKLMYYLSENCHPLNFHVTGIDFYQSKQFSKIWLPGYATNLELETNIYARTNFTHNIKDNAVAMGTLMDNYKWITTNSNIVCIIDTLMKDVQKNPTLELYNEMDNINEIITEINKSVGTVLDVDSVLCGVDVEDKNIGVMGLINSTVLSDIDTIMKPNNTVLVKTFDDIYQNIVNCLILIKYIQYFPNKKVLKLFLNKLNNLKIPKLVIHIWLGKTKCHKLKITNKHVYKTFICTTNQDFLLKSLDNYNYMHEVVVSTKYEAIEKYVFFSLKFNNFIDKLVF